MSFSTRMFFTVALPFAGTLLLHLLQWILAIGLTLPFVSGLWGLRAIYEGIMDLHDVRAGEDCRNRRCFLRRLTLSWAAVYTAVLPIMVYRLWEYFAAHFRMM